MTELNSYFRARLTALKSEIQGVFDVFRTTQVLQTLFVGIIAFFTLGCGGAIPRDISSECASLSGTSLSTYDTYSSHFLDETTKHPAGNLGGQVVWNTRYYMESLITAYEATNNPKYLTAFEDTASWVMGQMQTMTFVDVPDPSAPGKFVDQPTLTLTGWPTYLATLGKPISIPTPSGAVSFYAQSLQPTTTIGAAFVTISQQSDGTLQFAWARGGKNLQTYPLSSLADLSNVASQPLVYGQSPGRILATGAGLPAIGSYELDTPLTTIWHTEQTSGILLPFARFLLIAKDHPGVVDPGLAATWRSMVLLVASQVSSQFVSDGKGGYMLYNPDWMASTEAGTPAESDYVWVEISLRILLYELTGDSGQLAFARGILQHQLTQNVAINSYGWLVLRDWPDLRPWSTREEAPPGSPFDSLSYNLQVPESATDGGFFVEMLHLANSYELGSALGVPESLLAEQAATFHDYLLIPNAVGLGTTSSVRSAYPTLSSSPSDPVAVSQDPFGGAQYLEPESSVAEDWYANWQWMTTNGTTTQDWPVGYFLRAWARSESALARACVASPQH